MDPVKIPMIDYPFFTVDVVLDGAKLTFAFLWNTRASFWAMSISDANGTVLVSGVRLVCFYPLLTQYQHNKALPQGLLCVIDENQNTAKQEPGRYDFVSGRKLELSYAGTP
jgi:hypothetical protein